MKRREMLFRWICPEAESMLDQAKSIVREYEKAKDALSFDGKELSTKKGVVFLGHVTNSTVRVTPKLYTEVCLSKFELKSLLHLEGERQIVENSIFSGYDGKITCIMAESGEEGLDSARGIQNLEPGEDLGDRDEENEDD